MRMRIFLQVLMLILVSNLLLGENSSESPKISTNGLNQDPKLNPDVLLEFAIQGNLKKLKDVIESNKKLVDYRDPDGWTLLIIAARFGRKDVVEYLVSRNANVNATDKHGYTALHQAASYGNDDIIEFLLDHGANVNARTEGSVTARRLAASNGHRKAEQILEDHGGFR